MRQKGPWPEACGRPELRSEHPAAFPPKDRIAMIPGEFLLPDTYPHCVPFALLSSLHGSFQSWHGTPLSESFFQASYLNSFTRLTALEQDQSLAPSTQHPDGSSPEPVAPTVFWPLRTSANTVHINSGRQTHIHIK